MPRQRRPALRRQGTRRRAIRRPLPTARGTCFLVAALAALLAAVYLASIQILLVGIVLAVLPLIAMMTVALSRTRIVASRSLSPRVVPAGGMTEVTIRLDQVGTRAIGDASWRDLVSGSLTVQGRRPLLMNPGVSRVLRHTIRAETRGIYQLGPLVVLARDPFGLASGEYELGGARDLLVTPAVAELDEGFRDAVSSDGMARQALLRASPSADELMAREYRPGDPLRRVHWGATARHGELMVRQEEQRNNPEAWIVLDSVSTRAAERSDDFEGAIDFVASLGVHLLDRGFTVSVIETGEAQLFAGSAGQSSLVDEHPVAAYQLPGGDQQLLRGLVGVGMVEAGDFDQSPLRRAVGMRAPGADAAIFAVLVGCTEQEIRALVRLTSPSKPSIAFLTGPARADATDALTEAGWLCVPFDGRAAIADAWKRALDELDARDG